MDAVESPGDSHDHAADPMPAGTKVEVRNAFDRTWSTGFVIVDEVEDHYRIARHSDNAQLPGTFSPADVRRERKRSTWWV